MPRLAWLALAAVAALVGCSGSAEPTAGDKNASTVNAEQMIRENTALTPAQKEAELARLRAMPRSGP